MDSKLHGEENLPEIVDAKDTTDIGCRYLSQCYAILLFANAEHVAVRERGTIVDIMDVIWYNDTNNPMAWISERGNVCGYKL